MPKDKVHPFVCIEFQTPVGTFDVHATARQDNNLDTKSQLEVKRECMKARVLGNNEIANVRSHKIEEDKTGGGLSLIHI
eukprot:793026-Rhodomonas_salina.1